MPFYVSGDTQPDNENHNFKNQQNIEIPKK